MKEDRRMLMIEMRLNEIEDLVRDARRLVAVLIVICLSGFGYLSSLTDVIGGVGKVLLVMVIAAPLCYLILLVMEKALGVKKKLSFTEDDMQRILKEIEAEKENKSS